MKGKFVAFAGILCIASLIISGANAKGKPDKPGNTQTELIVFTGDLQGWAHVEGCCPNAGPFPEYELILPMDLVGTDGTYYPAGTYGGYVFMNGYRIGKDRGYKVQFWTDDLPAPGPDHICIEIYGGVPDYDKKTKVLTVTFESVEWNLMHDTEKNPIGLVSFVLTRSPI